MPDKEGAQEKSTTKEVVNKKQKQMMGEEGYDVARDEGRVKPSKDKKDGTSYPVSDEVRKTQKKNEGPSALEIVKKKYGKAVMDVEKKKNVSEEGKSLLSTPGLDKLKKIKDFKSNADRVFGRKSPDLTKVAESFGGQIVGEPVELDEIAITGTAAAAYYGIPALATAIGAYGTARQMQGKPLIPSIPNLGIKDKSKKVVNKVKSIFKSTSNTQGKSGQIEDPWDDDDYVSGNKPPDSSSTAQSGGRSKGSTYNRRVNRNVDRNVDRSFGDALKNNRNQQSGGGDNRRNQNQQSGGGNNRRNQNQQDTGGPTGGTGNRNNRNFDRRNRTYNTKDLTKELNKRKDQFNRNIFSRVKDNVKNMKNNKFVRNIIGKKKGGQLLRTGGATGAAGLGIGTALEKRRRLPRLPGLRVPDGGHVGRRTAG